MRIWSKHMASIKSSIVTFHESLAACYNSQATRQDWLALSKSDSLQFKIHEIHCPDLKTYSNQYSQIERRFPRQKFTGSKLFHLLGLPSRSRPKLWPIHLASTNLWMSQEQNNKKKLTRGRKDTQQNSRSATWWSHVVQQHPPPHTETHTPFPWMMTPTKICD